MNAPPVETEADVRARQTRILQVFASRLAHGDPLLPADVMSHLAEELAERIDAEAIANAWPEQDGRSPRAWRGETARANRRARGRDVREVWILERAHSDLENLDASAREEISTEIDALAWDPVPRGAAALHGHQDDHVSLHVGERRLLYKVLPHAVMVVAITSYE
jgi:mRNA-degrading endonuclease RelE of RelBE toxin-antitoxin system